MFTHHLYYVTGWSYFYSMGGVPQTESRGKKSMACHASTEKKKKMSGMHCIAPGCTNFFYSNPAVHYHRLPLSNQSRVKKWLQALKRKELPDLRFARVCSEHFLDSDYVYKGMFGADGAFKKEKTKDLNDTACPSKFDFSAYSTCNTDCPIAALGASTDSQRELRRKKRAATKVLRETQNEIEQKMREVKEDDADIAYQDNIEINEDVETTTKQSRTVGCQTDSVDNVGGSTRSIGICTEDIEQLHNTIHDHSYFKKRTLSTSDTLPDKSQRKGEDELSENGMLTDESSEEMLEEELECSKDPEFVPESPTESSAEESESDEENEQPNGMYIVYSSKLMELFTVCHEPGCNEPLIQRPKCVVIGFALIVTTECAAGHQYCWESHPKVNSIYAGNLLIPSAVFLAGSSFYNFSEICQMLKLQAPSPRHCSNIQAAYIMPEINKMWNLHSEAILAAVGDTPLRVSGDARCDSPGHCATYGTYTLLDVDSNLILAQETVRVTDVKNSYWLEPEGMQRCLTTLADHGCQVTTLATDRHPTVNKIMREKYPDVNHQFDLWHIVKSVKKKMLASKIPELSAWVRSVSNQLWFCAATCDGNPDKLKEKWISVLHHVTNRHEWVSGENFHKCDHPPYSREEEQKRPWLTEDSKAFNTLQKIVTDKRLLKDLEKVTECIQTGNLESIHSLYTKYVPKRKKYGRQAMEARLRLGALDHNYSSNRDQATCKAGYLRFKQEYSKSAGTYVVKPIPTQKNYSFREQLLCGIVHRCAQGLSQRKILQQRGRTDPSLGEHAGLAKPNKLRSVAVHVNRYIKYHQKGK